MSYETINFLIKNIKINRNNIYYYASSLLLKFNFKHAFFTKDSSQFAIEQLASKFNDNKINYFNNQIHSNFLVHGSELRSDIRFNADGILSDEPNQNLWIYTADCMPILVADKSSRLVAAIHCGRKGLEKNIIKNTLKKMEYLGSSKKNIIVAIGPSISRSNYFIDEDCLKVFYKNTKYTINSEFIKKSKNVYLNSIDKFSFDIKGFAFEQLINNNIKPENIEISNNCTFELQDQFHSWRRDKSKQRNWNFITSK